MFKFHFLSQSADPAASTYTPFHNAKYIQSLEKSLRLQDVEKEDARSDFETEFKKSFYRRPNTEEVAGGAPIHAFANNSCVRRRLILCSHPSCAGLHGNKTTRLIHPPSALTSHFRRASSSNPAQCLRRSDPQ